MRNSARKNVENTIYALGTTVESKLGDGIASELRGFKLSHGNKETPIEATGAVRAKTVRASFFGNTILS